MFYPKLQLLHLQKNAGKPSTVISSYKRVIPEEIKPHKIAAIKKHIYDRKEYTIVKIIKGNGQITDKGRLLLKELGVKQ